MLGACNRRATPPDRGPRRADCARWGGDGRLAGRMPHAFSSVSLQTRAENALADSQSDN